MLPLQWQAHVHRTLEFVTFGALLSASGALGLPRAKSGQIQLCLISPWNFNDSVFTPMKLPNANWPETPVAVDSNELFIAL